MASSLLRTAGQRREKLKRAGDAERDPAIPDLPETPSWEQQSASEPASDSAGDSASENAGSPANETDGGQEPEPGADPPAVKAPEAVRPPRRRGRPRGPQRVPLSVRIRTDLDHQLSAAVDSTGESPQYIVEAALERHFRALGIKRP